MQPSRRARGGRALLSAILAVAIPSGLAAAPPNIVLIVADDLGWADVPWHGGEIRTPNLDALARTGLRLEQHYVAPMCSPTRAALMSGRYWSRFGITKATNDRVMPLETVTLARALKAAGYDTALCGKWHLGSYLDWTPNRFGFDHSYGSLAGGVGPYNHFYKSGPFVQTWHRDGRIVEEAGHVTDLIAREAVQWIEGRGERPFFLYLTFTAPHIPIKEPPEWVERAAHVQDPAYRRFAACVSHMDDAIGRVLGAIERSGKRDRTLIVFTSDNGATPKARNDDPQYPADAYEAGPGGGRNGRLRGEKMTVYEGGIRVPALVSWRGTLKPGHIAAPIHAVDWMPTLSKLGGYRPDRDLKWDGMDVWPLLARTRPARARPLYWAGVDHVTAAFRLGDWKLVTVRGKPEASQLFNLAEDPYEKDDLATRQPKRVRELAGGLAEAARRDGDAVVRR
jgi:arylsulfatase A-like enzyme